MSGLYRVWVGLLADGLLFVGRLKGWACVWGNGGRSEIRVWGRRMACLRLEDGR